MRGLGEVPALHKSDDCCLQAAQIRSCAIVTEFAADEMAWVHAWARNGHRVVGTEVRLATANRELHAVWLPTWILRTSDIHASTPVTDHGSGDGSTSRVCSARYAAGSCMT